MTVVETLKKITEKATGWARPGQDALGKLIRARKPQTYRFKDDGIIPNHPRWPLVIYRGAVRLDEAFDPAALFEELFERNGWGDTWRNGIYDYVHYHSRIHEVLGIARGHGKVQFGGLNGRTISLKGGDVAICLPGPGINASAQAAISWSSAPIRRTALMTNAPRAKTARRRSRPSRRSGARAKTRSSGAMGPC